MQSASRNGGGGNGGAGGVSVREFLQTAVQLLQQLGRGELPADHQKFRFSSNDLRQARVLPSLRSSDSEVMKLKLLSRVLS